MLRQNLQTCNSLPTMLDVEVDNTIMIHNGSINILKKHVWSDKTKKKSEDTVLRFLCICKHTDHNFTCYIHFFHINFYINNVGH